MRALTQTGDRRAAGAVARAAGRALAARRDRDALRGHKGDGGSRRAPLVQDPADRTGASGAHHLVQDPAERVAMPHRGALEERFGRPLTDIDVYAGPRSAEALRRLGAVSAATGRSIFLPHADAPTTVVAHEVAHVLQTRLAVGTPPRADIEPAGSRAEREAALAAAGPEGRTDGPVEITEGLAPGIVALLRQSTPPAMPTPETPTLTLGANPAVPAIDQTPAPPEPASAPAPTASVAPAVAAPAAQPGPSTAGQAAPAAELTAPQEAPGAGIVTAPVADPAAAAAQEEAAAAAQEAIAAAATPGDRLRAYAKAPPSVKATQTASLSTGMADLAAEEARAVQSGVPPVQVALPGEPTLAKETAAAPASPGPAPTTDLAPAPAPASAPPEIATPEVPGAFHPASDVSSPLALASNAPPETLAARIDDSLAAVPTSDTDVPRSAGTAPPIVLSGESDPARVGEVDEKGRAQGADARDAAARAVREGPGPQHVQPIALEASQELTAAVVAARPAAPAPPGPEQFAAMQLPPDVQRSFDQQQGPGMEQSLTGAVAETDKAAADRDVARQEALDRAHAGEEQLHKDAEAGRTEAVSDARQEIGKARDDTLAAQDAELTRVEGEAAERRKTDTEAVQHEVDGGRKTIDADFAKADSDIKTEVASGEQKATAEKQKAERDAESQSWWDKAVDFVKSAISSLVAAVGKIFDAVRAAVNKVLDAVKKAALAVIAGIASFVKAAIAAFGAFLKAAITGLIGQIFPGLAAKLNGLIDSAVAYAQKAVDVVADKLSKGVSALVEGLRAGLNKAIDVFQAGVEFAVGLAAAAITGDWGALFRKVLEAVLRLVGVEPEQFYAFVGRAEETLGIIVNNPLGFVGNLAKAVKGGIVAFADNIGTHLKEGVVGWLTGALGPAGITIPKTFDLMGVLDLARQILGLTWENLKAKAVKLIGEKNVERIEQAASWIGTLVTEGWSGLWARIMADLASLRDAVFDGIRTFIQERVIMSAITKLASLLNPVGAIVQLVIAAWNMYTFLRDQLARLVELVRTVVDTIGDIARGILDNSIKAVEGVLGRLLPLAIDLLARLIGLGNVGGKVRELLEKVRGAVDKAIDKLIAKVVGLFKGGRGKAGAKDAAASESVDATETFHIAGETHTLKSQMVGGHVAATMASSSFGPLSQRIGATVKFIEKLYLAPASDRYIGAQRAQELAPNVSAIQAKADSMLAALADIDKTVTDDASRAKASRAQKKVIRDGFTALRKAIEGLGLPDVSVGGAPLGSTPGIGDIEAHGAQRKRNRSGANALLHTESEHIIPYATGAVLLEAADASAGERADNRRFDQALITIVIYERAARIKTPLDNKASEGFRKDTAGIVAQADAARKAAKAPPSWDVVVALLDHIHTAAVARTINAVKKEHGETTAPNAKSNGQVRGEKQPVPTASAIKDAGQREFTQLNAIFRRLWLAGAGAAKGTGQAELSSVTLAGFNVMQPDVIATVQGIGAKKAAEIVAERTKGPFTSKADLRARVPGLSGNFLKAIKDGS